MLSAMIRELQIKELKEKIADHSLFAVNLDCKKGTGDTIDDQLRLYTKPISFASSLTPLMTWPHKSFRKLVRMLLLCIFPIVLSNLTTWRPWPLQLELQLFPHPRTNYIVWSRSRATWSIYPQLNFNNKSIIWPTNFCPRASCAAVEGRRESWSSDRQYSYWLLRPAGGLFTGSVTFVEGLPYKYAFAMWTL